MKKEYKYITITITNVLVNKHPSYMVRVKEYDMRVAGSIIWRIESDEYVFLPFGDWAYKAPTLVDIADFISNHAGREAK
jgi:hypothetical protein